MHRQLTDAPRGKVVDHADRNPLNNTRANLRICTQSENTVNRVVKPTGSSRFKGVYWWSDRNRWAAEGFDHGRKVYLGSFVTEEDAARAYDAHMVATYGDFALINFSREDGTDIARCTHSTHNHAKRQGTSSAYKGVSWDKRRRKWRARIVQGRREIPLGHFINEIDAARAYDEAARRLSGDLAQLNFKEDHI